MASTHRRFASTLLSRRRLLQFGAGSAGSAGLACLPWQTAHAAARDTMRTRPIPASGEMLPVMGLGSSGAFSTYAVQGLTNLRQVMQRFVSMGGSVVDTSPTYGNAEGNIGHIAHQAGIRDQLFMATKVDTYGKRAGREQMRRSRQKLGPPIDLMQIHNLVDTETQWATIQQMKAEGQLRYIGITHYLTSAFEKLEHHMSTKDMDFVQFNYSIMTPEAEQRLLPLAAERGIAVLINRPFNDGRLFSLTDGHKLPDYAAQFDCTSWAQFALKYVLANTAVTAVIPATSNQRHLADNMRSGYGRLPDMTMRKRMRKTLMSIG